MTTILQFLVGVLACLVFIFVLRLAGRQREPRMYAVGLVFAAFVYVGFAALAGGGLSWLAVEIGGAAIFALVAFLGLRISVWFLALGWAAHVGWDVLLHKVQNVGFVPEWYPVMCIGFDLFLAGYIATCVRGGLGASSLRNGR